MADCVGCGYCCSKVICSVGVRAYNALKSPCPGLIWDQEANRHWCKLARMSGQQGIDYRAELFINTGCSSSLFNDWREDIHDRTFNKVYKQVKMDKYFKLFIYALSKQWMSGDVLALTIGHWIMKLREEGVDESIIEGLVGEIQYIFGENRASYLKDFLG